MQAKICTKNRIKNYLTPFNSLKVPFAQAGEGVDANGYAVGCYVLEIERSIYVCGIGCWVVALTMMEAQVGAFSHYAVSDEAPCLLTTLRLRLEVEIVVSLGALDADHF